MAYRPQTSAMDVRESISIFYVFANGTTATFELCTRTESRNSAYATNNLVLEKSTETNADDGILFLFYVSILAIRSIKSVRHPCVPHSQPSNYMFVFGSPCVLDSGLELVSYRFIPIE